MTNSNTGFTIHGHEPAKDPDYLRVTFHNRDPIEIPISAWVEFSLKDGLELSQAAISELEAAAAMANWKARAMRYLSYKPRTKAEVTRYLTGKGADAEAARTVVEVLEQEGYLSDAKYAELFVQSYRERASRREIAWRLGQKGIAGKELEEAFQDPEIYEGEVEAAEQIARKAIRSGKNQDPMTLRKRAWNRLQRKGFSRETTRIAVGRAMAEIESIAQPEFLDND